MAEIIDSDRKGTTQPMNMNDLENYRDILELYFGAGAATFATTPKLTNNIIGALNNSEFSSFRSVFLERCQRLANSYPAGNVNRKPLLDRLNEMASVNKWDGVYAEMVALDFLNSDRDLLSCPIELSKTVPATETLAGSLGGKNANYDGFYTDFNVYFDVKTLGDKSLDILKGVIDEAKSALSLTHVEIRPEYPLDMDFEPFQQGRSSLVAELQKCIDPRVENRFIKSTVLQGLNYRLSWSPGVLTTVSEYDPHQHAANHHALLFKYAKKFSRISPSLVIFVVFPWFSESVLNSGGSNEHFYRAFCRRFFCQYAKDASPASSLLKSFQGTESVAQVTKSLSGVLFLEDTTIKASNSAVQNVKPFAYLNPNATHKVSNHFQKHLLALRFVVDTFAHDNY